MRPVGFHITFRLKSSKVIAPRPADQRAAARAVLEAARPFQLLVFRLADTHSHVVTVEDRPTAGELVRRIEIGIQNVLDIGDRFAEAHYEPILDQYHLRNAFDYVLSQDSHHGFGHDPFFEASNLPDMVGLRHVGQQTGWHVRAHLPRVTRGDLLRHLGALDLAERAVDPAKLADAAAAAACLPDLSGRTPDAVQARLAAVHALPGLSARAIGDLLGLPIRTVQRNRAEPAPPRLVAAVCGQLALRSAPRETGGVGESPAPLDETSRVEPPAAR